MLYSYVQLDIVVYVRHCYGRLRIFPREVVGCMTLLYELDIQKYSASMPSIYHWYILLG
jgi:hypothetical protein